MAKSKLKAKSAPKKQAAKPERVRATPAERKAHWQSIGLAVLSGCLWFLACADFDIWPLAYVAMLPGFWAVEHAPTRRKALFYGWLVGLVANTGGGTVRENWRGVDVTRVSSLAAIGSVGVCPTFPLELRRAERE